MLALTHPRHLMWSDADIKGFMKDGTRPDVVNARVRGGSDEIIPPLCSMAGIAPMNIPLVFGMLVTPPSAQAATLGLHFVNQTYNSACNYFNRAGDSLTMEAMAQSYGAACASAMTMAFGLGKLLARGPPALRGIPWLIPAVASASAGSSNLLFMRMNEVTEGTNVYDMDGTLCGKSRVAGTDAVMKTAVSRCCLVPTSVLILPSYAMKFISPIKVVQANPRLRILLEVSCVYAALAVALPSTLAMFPPTTTFKAEDLEVEFHNLKDKNGQRVEYLIANKGM